MVLLTNRVEEAAAPGEAVLVDGYFVAIPLYFEGSRELKQQMALAGRGVALSSLLHYGEESVVVTRYAESLAGELRREGWVVRREAPVASSRASGGWLYGRGQVEVLFVVSPATQGTGTAVSSRP
jgi:hypothetical protein